MTDNENTNNNSPVDTGVTTNPTIENAEPAHWTSSIEDADIKSWVEKKNFKTSQDALKSYRELERFLGADKNDIMRVPKSGSLDELRPIFNKLGRPETPDKYELPVMEDDVIGFNDWFRSAAHDADMTAAQAKQFAEQYDKFGRQIMEQEAKQTEERHAQEVEELKKEWGLNFETNQAYAAGAVRSMADEATFEAITQAIGPKAAMQLFAKIGQMTGEGKFVQSRNVADTLPVRKSEAEAELKRMRTDVDIQAKLKSKDPQMTKRWQDLIKMVAS